ncbi:MAG: hypothetical protein NkDv07_0088 [Candidatus Improbicoccus devescovinae]|nr:MAG: hypothetical protein NkDv07_0088 [Candidatus Improbicoccus devescovinae]
MLNFLGNFYKIKIFLLIFMFIILDFIFIFSVRIHALDLDDKNENLNSVKIEAIQAPEENLNPQVTQIKENRKLDNSPEVFIRRQENENNTTNIITEKNTPETVVIPEARTEKPAEKINEAIIPRAPPIQAERIPENTVKHDTPVESQSQEKDVKKNEIKNPANFAQNQEEAKKAEINKNDILKLPEVSESEIKKFERIVPERAKKKRESNFVKGVISVLFIIAGISMLILLLFNIFFDKPDKKLLNKFDNKEDLLIDSANFQEKFEDISRD